MRLRPATADDLDGIDAVFARARDAMFTYLHRLHTPEEDRQFLAGLLETTEVWVAEEGGRVAGFAALAEELLEHIYAFPHGRGVGSALLERAKELRPSGFRLWVFQRNEGARRLYERHGMRLVRLTDGAGNEQGEPDAMYEWRP
ncbi:MAG TPA: GNAT family N-acetyltransferase [Gaiellaceae bacterium]